MISLRTSLFNKDSALPPPRLLASFGAILSLCVLTLWNLSKLTGGAVESTGGIGSCIRDLGGGGKGRLPVLYFVAGVEGSGHDFIEAFFE